MSDGYRLGLYLAWGTRLVLAASICSVILLVGACSHTFTGTANTSGTLIKEPQQSTTTP